MNVKVKRVRLAPTQYSPSPDAIRRGFNEMSPMERERIQDLWMEQYIAQLDAEALQRNQEAA
jgi:hypothetical protein